MLGAGRKRMSPTYLVRFRPEPGIDGIKALRMLLKIALRRLGLRALEVRQEPETRDQN
jgi:hypothetical protein